MKSQSFSRASRIGAALTGAALLSVSLVPVVQACTRVLWNDDPSGSAGVLVGRTMDWPTSTSPVLTFFPRGSAHNGGQLGALTVVRHNPLEWRAKYASLVTTIYGVGAADGVNEKGLAAHLLYLNETDLGPRDPSRPGLQVGLWAQYVLDNAATVEEALATLDKVQVVMATVTGPNGRQIKGAVHLVMEDATGDSALIEYIGGKKIVHHGRDVRVVTNDPPYDQQMATLKTTISSMEARGESVAHPNSSTALPGNVSPLDRLVRASYFLHLLPPPKTEREGIADMLAITRNVSVPFGAPYKPAAGMAVYNTEYRTAISLKSGAPRYFFELTTQPNLVRAELSRITVPALGQVMQFDPYRAGNSDAAGDISAHFLPGKAPY
ncbi:linear amide C-N hydrolase [Serratia quinivorans]|uniref:linear amide C-N hydrolase n=1 Tax=Serratia quinivorans TaxID=137545 RepID=UPI002179BE0C|nr:linear amide C-N hydrolase [Serratia quinivorans]CAI1015622.1 Choloylglycine hydrolase [Serratia quinivorans]